ncbi:MAG: hypothetical protein ACXAB2_14170 [Candidatus Hodarchaeales archaeon]|jgi:hypothetical protein
MNQKKKRDQNSKTLYEIWKTKLLNKPVIVIIVIVFTIGIGFMQFTKEILSIFDSSSNGKLELTAIKVTPDPKRNICLVDFRLINVGKTIVVVNEIEFEVKDIVSVDIRGPLGFSSIYDLDISELNDIGDKISVDASQEIKPNEADRFGVKITAQNIPPGIERGWRLLPKLITSAGKLEAEQIEIWFPYDYQQSGYFEEAKKIEVYSDSMKNVHGIKSGNNNMKKDIPRPKFEDVEAEKIFNSLIEEKNLIVVASILSKIQYKEYANKIVISEMFGKNFIEKVKVETDAEIITNCFTNIWLINKDICKTILRYRDFGVSVLSQKLNDEPDIRKIGLLIGTISQCDYKVGQNILNSFYFDKDSLIQKLNDEKNVWEIGRSIERIWAADTNFGKEIVESRLFDKKFLLNKLKNEENFENISMCLGGIKFASEETYQSLHDSLNHYNNKNN